MRNKFAFIQRKLSNPDYVRDVSSKAFLVVVLQQFVIVFLTVLVVALTLRPPVTHFFYTDGRGTPREIYPTDRPAMSDARTLRWTVDAVAAAYNLDYAHYGKQLDEASESFDTQGFNSWASSFKRAGNLDALEQGRLIMTAVPSQAPSIRWSGIVNGRYTYRIVFRMLVKYENKQGSKNDVLIVTAIVARTTDPLHPDGLVVTELNAPQDNGQDD